jgi:hypothetical protein
MVAPAAAFSWLACVPRAFHRFTETVSRSNFFVLAQFRTEGYGEVAELNHFTLFLELL